MILRGDGTWPFTVKFTGTLFVENVVATWFGGDDDPQDNGETASGFPTKGHPNLLACSLPMDFGQRVKWTDGSPIPRLPWGLLPNGQPNPLGTFVEVWPYNPSDPDARQKAVHLALIDDGPGKQATKDPKAPHAIDLTKKAFAVLAEAIGKDPDQAIRDGTMRVSFVITA